VKRLSCMRCVLVLVALAFVLFTAGTAMASGLMIFEKSVKGLGNAFAGNSAVAEDASTIYFNPAGMTRLPGHQVLAGCHVIMPYFKFDDDGSAMAAIFGGAPLTGGNGGDAGGVFFVPNFYSSFSITDDLKFGIGMTSPFGLGTEYDGDWVGRYHTVKSDIMTIDINPSIAYRIHKMFSIGAGVSVQYIDAELTQKIDFGTMDAALAGGAYGLTPQGSDGKGEITGDDWAFGFNVGVLFEPTENTRFGLSYRSRIKYELEGEADFSYPNAAAAALAANPLVNAVDSDVDADITLPDSLSFSAYHQLTEHLAIMADVTWVNWSCLDELRIKFDSGADDSVVTLKWENSFRYSIGATFQATEQLTLRTGVAYDETPVPSAKYRTPRVPDDDRIWLALGLSYQFTEMIGLDIGYTYIFAGDAEIKRIDTGALGAENTLAGSLVGDYNAYSNIISFQLSVKF